MRILCQGCGRRRVRYVSRAAEYKRGNRAEKRRKWHGDKQHDLCRQCYRTTMEPVDVIRDVAKRGML